MFRGLQGIALLHRPPQPQNTVYSISLNMFATFRTFSIILSLDLCSLHNFMFAKFMKMVWNFQVGSTIALQLFDHLKLSNITWQLNLEICNWKLFLPSFDCIHDEMDNSSTQDLSRGSLDGSFCLTVSCSDILEPTPVFSRCSIAPMQMLFSLFPLIVVSRVTLFRLFRCFCILIV